jgi:signal peptidase I
VSTTPESDDRSTGSSLLELVVIVAVALGLALGIQAFLIKPFRIPSGSMLPTLQIGERVLVNRVGTHFRDPHTGDILVFHPPASADAESGPQCAKDPAAGAACSTPGTTRANVNFIKRVVGVAGDRIAVRNGHVIRNGKLQKEPFISHTCDGGRGNACNLPTAITVPPGHYFMMGDNRGESDDSRYWGPIPKSWVIGGAFATYWPPRRIGTL